MAAMMVMFGWDAAGAVAGWLAVAVCVSLAVVIAFGYRAEEDWTRGEELLAARRARRTAV